ncbi:unnamed protein product [Rhizophagus irregularis]|nr:unnamed protein product [Rhizophagus irregularis]
MDFRYFDFRKRGNEMMVLQHASLGYEMVFRYSTSGSKELKGSFGLSVFDFGKQGTERILRYSTLEGESVPDVRMMVPDVRMSEMTGSGR